MSRIERINQVLQTMSKNNPEIQASALISEDALLIASALPEHIEEGRVAAMTATLLNLGSRVGRELKTGALREVLIRGEDGYVSMMNATTGTLLLVLAEPSAKLGLLLIDMKDAITSLKELFGN